MCRLRTATHSHRPNKECFFFAVLHTVPPSLHLFIDRQCAGATILQHSMRVLNINTDCITRNIVLLWKKVHFLSWEVEMYRPTKYVMCSLKKSSFFLPFWVGAIWSLAARTLSICGSHKGGRKGRRRIKRVSLSLSLSLFSKIYKTFADERREGRLIEAQKSEGEEESAFKIKK